MSEFQSSDIIYWRNKKRFFTENCGIVTSSKNSTQVKCPSLMRWLPIKRRNPVGAGTARPPFARSNGLICKYLNRAIYYWRLNFRRQRRDCIPTGIFVSFYAVARLLNTWKPFTGSARMAGGRCPPLPDDLYLTKQSADRTFFLKLLLSHNFPWRAFL